MGNLCCCFQPEDPEDNNATSSFHTNASLCSNCFLHSLFTKYAAIFTKEEGPVVGVPAANNAQPDNTIAPPEIMSFDGNPNHPNWQQDGLTLPIEKASGQMHNKNTPQMTGEDDLVSDNISEVASSEHNSSMSPPTTDIKEKLEPEFHYINASLDDEDVCPTCLEEYSSDNPRIVTECKHHYHLGCIYEWQERSKTCPLCGKVMLFDETTWTLSS